MGEVIRPEDVVKGRKRLIKEVVKDLNPGVRDLAVEILESWEGAASKRRLVKLLGEEEAKGLLDRMKMLLK